MVFKLIRSHYELDRRTRICTTKITLHAFEELTAMLTSTWFVKSTTREAANTTAVASATAAVLRITHV